MFDRFIERPVLSTVISVLIVILGVLGLTSLPVAQYPEIAPPTIVVSASYQGASADVVLNSVVVPLEEQLNGVEGMSYMTSSAGNDGSARITITFKLGINADIASVNVQNRVALATPLLPQEVVRTGVITRKTQSSNLLIFSLYSDNPAYDQTFVQNYADINLVPIIKRVPGVGDASAFGQRIYSMRIWLKPDVMAAYGLVPSDVSAALAEQNIEAAPGQFGEQGGQSFQYTIKYKGRLKNAEEFGNMIIRATPNGQILRLKDIAQVELGAISYGSSSATNGKPSVGVAISQTAGSNAQDVIKGSLQVLQDASKSFPKGVSYVSLFNINDFLSASITKVLHTLIEAFILVFIVVFLFLQDLRSTLIPAIAVPVAILGTFFFLNLFGFTINLLTLFALLLAIGIVVDDAIVVVEAVHAKLDQGYTSALKASKDAMHEISGAIISITLVMAAVFVPVSFIGGSAGVFYKQFGLTLAIAIILSAVNALTLSPALAALFLKPHKEEGKKKKNLLQRFYIAFNAGFDATRQKYEKTVTFLSHTRWIAFAVILIFSGLFYYLMKTTPTSFVPDEDLGAIMTDIALPPSASLERTSAIADQVEKIASTIPEVQNILKITGFGMISGSGSNYAMVIMKLKPWDQRKGKHEDVKSIIGQLFAKTSGIRDAKIIFFAPPTLSGFGNSGGFSFQLQDKTGNDIASFYKVNMDFLAALNQRPEIQYATTSFSPNFPQYQIDVDVAKVKEAGLTVNDILNTMQGYYGGVYASNFNQFGKQYRVMYQADPAFRANPESLNNIYVRNASGTMAPITGFITLEKVYGPQSISRFNLFTSIGITGAPNAGYSSGDAIKAIEEVAATSLPIGYGYEFSGLTREELSAGSQTVFIFMLIIVFIYFLLSAQYESYLLPFSILLSLPVGLAGAFLFARIFGVSNNIYLQITLIMLVGLLAKNAILIVEFALDRRKQGMPIIQAAIQGAEARLRPILMTSFAFIFGIMPLMLANGAGAAGNRSIGTGAVGGMLIGTLIGVFVIPTLFIVFQSLQEKISGPPKPSVRKNNDSSTEIAQPSDNYPGI
jgi:hydrophobic/amphiphilic exporter-1 (mainly G- bacteria), HAE1 family